MLRWAGCRFTDVSFAGVCRSSVAVKWSVVAIGQHHQARMRKNSAVIGKMIRVMMLAPFLLILCQYLSRQKAVRGGEENPKSLSRGLPSSLFWWPDLTPSI